MSNCWPKIWGTNMEIYSNDLCSINKLHVKKGGVCSWHSHKVKYNIFFVVSGKLEIQTDIGNSVLVEDQNFMISPGTKHLFRALEDTIAIEIMFVKYDHNDIQREKVGFIEEVEK